MSRLITLPLTLARTSRLTLSSSIAYSFLPKQHTRMAETTSDLHKSFEPHPNPPTKSDGSADYVPDPSKSIKLPAERQKIVDVVIRLYSCTFTDEDLEVYDEKAIYDDPLSYCDTREKIATQWVGLKKVMSDSVTEKYEVTENSKSEIILKMQQLYHIKPLNNEKRVNNLVSLGLDENDKIKYHKDQWNEKDYSHQGLGKWLKTLQGDALPMVTTLPDNIRKE